MEYRFISADSHIDLSWIPYDLFVSNSSQAMKDRMPYVTQGADGPMWVTKSGLNLGFANGAGGTGAVSSMGLKYVRGRDFRLDRMADTGLFSDGIQGKFRPTTPELRLQDQNRDGIQAEILYGLLHTGNKLTDRDASVEFYRIYNEWLANFCSYDPKRFVGLASTPCHNVDVAVAETRRASKLGLSGVDLAAFFDMIPLWNPYWNPLWKAASEAKLPVHFHTIGTKPEPVLNDLPDVVKHASRATKVAGNKLPTATILAAVIHGGALERFPDLQIVFGESDIGWIPYILDRMDYEYEDRFKKLIPYLKLKPSEYWRRQCHASFQNDRIGIKNLEEIGIETVMWASDYPHPDGVFPDSQEHIERQFGHLPSATQRKIVCENAARFYGLIDA